MKITEPEHEELLFLLDARLTDIRDLKSDQRRYAYVSLIGFAALFSSVHLPEQAPSTGYKIGVVLACLGILFVWWNTHRAVQHGVKISRISVNFIYGLLSEAARQSRPQNLVSNHLNVPTMQGWAVYGTALFVILNTIASIDSLPRIQLWCN